MRYNMETGQVVLTGAPGDPVPRVVNEQIQVDSTRHRDERRRLEDEGVQRNEARAVDHVPAEEGREERRPDAGLDAAGPAGERREPRAPLYGGRERLNRSHRDGDARPGREERDADQRRQGHDRRQDGQPVAQGSVISQMLVQDVNPTTKAARDDALDGIRPADAVRRRDAQGDLHDQSARGRAPGRFDGRDDRPHARRERSGHRAARSRRATSRWSRSTASQPAISSPTMRQKRSTSSLAKASWSGCSSARRTENAGAWMAVL